MQNQTRNKRRTDNTVETMVRLGDRFYFDLFSRGWSAQCRRCGERAVASGAVRWADAHTCAA